MNILDTYFSGFRKYLDFKSRATRMEFWTFAIVTNLFLICLYVLAAILAFGLEANNLSIVIIVISILFNLVTVIPSLAVFVRRLHDVGKGGEIIFFMFIPLIGIFVLFYLLYICIQPSGDDNNYGPKPRA